jgi:hypothetical protein
VGTTAPSKRPGPDRTSTSPRAVRTARGSGTIPCDPGDPWSRRRDEPSSGLAATG